MKRTEYGTFVLEDTKEAMETPAQIESRLSIHKTLLKYAKRGHKEGCKFHNSIDVLNCFYDAYWTLFSDKWFVNMYYRLGGK